MQTIRSPEDPESLIGRVLPGGLQIVERLGATAEGPLYRGQYAGGGSPVAITVLRLPTPGPGPPGTSALSERHWEQLRRACRIQHPNVASLLDAGETPDGIVYAVGELLTGELVSDILAVSGGMPPAQAVDICLQVAEGLRAAHATGVVHGSVSPHTVLVTGGGDHLSVKLIRFDFAGYGDDQPGARQPIRERWSDDELDPTEDIVGLGVLLHCLLTGTPPDSERGPHAMPHPLRRIIDRALGARGRPYPTVAALAEDLARQAGASARQPRHSRRRLAIQVASAALVAAGVWFAWTRAEDSTEARNEVGARAPEAVADSQPPLDTVRPPAAASRPTARRGSVAVSPTAPSPSRDDSSAVVSPFRRSHPWAAQPDGRVYFPSGCPAALRATDLIYFRSEAEARASGRTRSGDPHCS